MNTLDLVLLAILVVFTLVDAFLGFINVAITFGGLFLGIIFAGVLSDPLANALVFIHDKSVAKGVAFVLIVVFFGLIAHIITLLLGLIPFFGIVNHILGAALGLVQGFLICAVVLVGAILVAPDLVQQSTIAKTLVKPLSNVAVSLAPAPFKDLVQQAANGY